MNKFPLPLGSIVILEGGHKSIMICGRLQENMETKKVFDYCACLYPEGVMSSDQMYLFQHEDIKQIVLTGYASSDEVEFRKFILTEKKSITNNSLK